MKRHGFFKTVTNLLLKTTSSTKYGVLPQVHQIHMIHPTLWEFIILRESLKNFLRWKRRWMNIGAQRNQLNPKCLIFENGWFIQPFFVLKIYWIKINFVYCCLWFGVFYCWKYAWIWIHLMIWLGNLSLKNRFEKEWFELFELKLFKIFLEIKI